MRHPVRSEQLPQRRDVHLDGIRRGRRRFQAIHRVNQVGDRGHSGGAADQDGEHSPLPTRAQWQRCARVINDLQRADHAEVHRRPPSHRLADDTSATQRNPEEIQRMFPDVPRRPNPRASCAAQLTATGSLSLPSRRRRVYGAGGPVRTRPGRRVTRLSDRRIRRRTMPRSWWRRQRSA